MEPLDSTDGCWCHDCLEAKGQVVPAHWRRLDLSSDLPDEFGFICDGCHATREEWNASLLAKERHAEERAKRASAEIRRMEKDAGKKRSREKNENFEAIVFPTPRPLWVAGMPRTSAMLSIPAALYEISGPGETTAHRRTTLQRPADKAKQRDVRVAHAGIALEALPKDGGIKLKVQHQPLVRWAAALGYRWPQSASRLLRRKGHAVIRVVRTKQQVEAQWDLTEVARPGYDSICFQPGSAAELATMEKHAGLFSAAAVDGEAKLSEVKFRKFAAISHDPLSILKGTKLAVYDYLVAHGLYVYEKSGKRWKAGKVQQTQEQIAAALGYSLSAVRRALRRLSVSWTDRKGNKHAGLGLILFIGKPGAYYWKKNGAPLGECPKATIQQHKRAGLIKWRQDEPNEYIGVCDWVETEKERYERAMEPVRATQSEWAALMDKIFARALVERSELDAEAFQAACRQLMKDEGVPEWQIDVVFPDRAGPP